MGRSERRNMIYAIRDMTTETQIYALGTCALSICALSAYAISTCALGILRISEWSIILSSPRSYCPVPNAVHGLLSRHGTGDNYKLLVHIFLTLCCRASTFVERPLQINLSVFKTKPIYRIPKMNVNSVKTKDYENKRLCALRKTNPIKPKTNPIKPNFKRKKEKDFTAKAPIPAQMIDEPSRLIPDVSCKNMSYY